MSQVQIAILESTTKEKLRQYAREHYHQCCRNDPDFRTRESVRHRILYRAKYIKHPKPIIDKETKRQKARAAECRYRIKNKETYVKNSRKHAQKHWNLYARLKTKELRLAAIKTYGGPICKCCGENTAIEFLAIDHISNGRGNPPKYRGARFYAWLKKNGYPSGFQVLCHSCNCAKGYYGSCPHTKMKTPIDLWLEQPSS